MVCRMACRMVCGVAFNVAYNAPFNVAFKVAFKVAFNVACDIAASGSRSTMSVKNLFRNQETKKPRNREVKDGPALAGLLIVW